MKKLLLAVTVAIFAMLVAMTGAKAAPIAANNLPHSAVQQGTIKGLVMAHIVDGRPRHNCRRHGLCGGGFGFGAGGIYIGPGYYGYHGSYTRSCRRVRRWCRREWGGGRRYRRCARRQDCRP